MPREVPDYTDGEMARRKSKGRAPGSWRGSTLRASLVVSLRRPGEFVDRVRNKWESWRARDETWEEAGLQRYGAEPQWEAALHRFLGIHWPCQQVAEFDAIWDEVISLLRPVDSSVATRHDADRALALAAYCATRHRRPVRVVETGVARGITSRMVLEALERNGSGHLWSIDLPPLRDPWRGEVGRAVPSRLLPRWTYVRGSSRRRLSRVVRDLGQIDVFIHDSLHTEANLLFELGAVWERAPAGGVIIADDIHMHSALSKFVGSVGHSETLVAEQDGKDGLFGIIVKASLTD